MATNQKQTERNAAWLLAGISGISLLAWLINSYAPTLWSMIVFFLLMFFTTIPLLFFLLNNFRRSFLIAGGVTGYVMLRMIGLREPLYLILLAASLVSLELYLNKR